MPIPRVSMGERGDYPFGGKSSYDQRIFVNVNVIVEVDEIVSQRLTEYGPRNRHETKADEEVDDRRFRVTSADTRSRGRDPGRLLAAVGNLPFFHTARARATSWHLLSLDHVAVGRIDREQCCFRSPPPKQGSPG